MVPETEDYTIAPDIARWVLTHRVRDMKVDADAIHRQNGLNLSVGVHKAGALLWGSLASCGRLAIGRTQTGPPRLNRTAAVANRREGCQPAPHHASDSTLMSCSRRSVSNLVRNVVGKQFSTGRNFPY